MNEANTWLFLVITGMRTIKIVLVIPLLLPIKSFLYTTYNLTTMHTNSSFYISKTFLCKMLKCAYQMSTRSLKPWILSFLTFQKHLKCAYQMLTLCPWSRECFLSESIGCSTPSCPTAATSRGTTAGKGWSPKSKT